jgi:hypothetical protein
MTTTMATTANQKVKGSSMCKKKPKFQCWNKALGGKKYQTQHKSIEKGEEEERKERKRKKVGKPTRRRRKQQEKVS